LENGISSRIFKGIRKIKVMPQIRFRDEFLFITGMGFGILTFFTDSLFPYFMFGACFGFMIINQRDRKRNEKL
jgi:hypothetical protein